MADALENEDCDINDAFDNVVFLEEKFVKEGYREGAAAGEERGVKMGFDTGFKKGADISHKLGYIEGYITFYIEHVDVCDKTKVEELSDVDIEKRNKINVLAKNIRELCSSFSVDGYNERESYFEDFAKIRFKFKQFKSLLGHSNNSNGADDKAGELSF